jgi:hypothetical protein
MTEYQIKHDYNRTALVLEEAYPNVKGPLLDVVAELHGILKRAATADNKDTELACLKNAQETLNVMQDLLEEQHQGAGHIHRSMERLQEILRDARYRVERGLPPDESMRGRESGASSGRRLSLALALCLTV